jgi:phosphatidylserine/phosphatidylglycerophosphate/cardiolipin synthase-like enzyme
MRMSDNQNGVFLKAYAGASGVLLAMDIDPGVRPGLLGFAIDRRDANKQGGFLPGMLHFPGENLPAGTLVESDKAPIQKFRWSDYAVHTNTTYTYTVHPVHGQVGALQLDPGPSVTITTANTQTGDHRIVFNRAVAASQAFSRKFPETEATIGVGSGVKSLSPDAYTWLSHGVLEQIVGFIGRASDSSWALDIAIYQFELAAIITAIKAAADRGVQVRVIYHSKAGDPQTQKNKDGVAALGTTNVEAHPRETTHIFHHKYIVLSQLDGTGTRAPQAVLCGSTNFTTNGVYYQANVVHEVEQPAVAQRYLDLFEELLNHTPDQTRDFVMQTDPFPAPMPPLFVGFSPRSGDGDLTQFVNEIHGAKRDVLFSTAFNLNANVQAALVGAAGDAILRYGVQDKATEITGLNAGGEGEFTATAMVKTGLEGFLQETHAGEVGPILIHTKIIVIDFTTDTPVVISGSHNYSENASSGNDENYFILRGDPDIGDAYGIEVLRLFDHYRFRYHLAQQDKEGAQPLALTTDDTWTDRYFGGDALKTLDRERFAGRAPAPVLPS